MLPEQTCLPPPAALFLFTLSLCFSRSRWCSEEGQFSSSRPNFGHRAPCCMRAPGRGLGAALPPAGGASAVWCQRGPGLHPPTPPAVLGGRTDLERGPWRRGPLSPRKAGRLVGREDCVPHNPPRGALPQAVALVPVVPPSPLRPWPTGWSARVRTSPGSHAPARHLSPQLSSETASPCTHTGGTGSGRSPDALRELNVFLCNF